MSHCAASSVGLISMNQHSQIANLRSSGNNRKTGNYFAARVSHNAEMVDEDDKNGGPNHLKAWMRHRNVKGVELAERLGGNVTPGMVSDLANSNRALSAKWLRRLADALKTTPGMLLDHNPEELDTDIIDIWSRMDTRQKRQMTDIAHTLTGTNGK